MKKSATFFHIIPLVALMLLSLPVFAANGDTCAIPTYPQSGSDTEHPIDSSPEGVRSPARPIFIYMNSEKGVVIPGMEKGEVIAYEAYDKNETLLVSFTDDIEFANFALSYSGVLEIRIVFAEYFLRGYKTS